ncbi:MAG: ribonuclease HII [Nitrososphaeria archaeon]
MSEVLVGGIDEAGRGALIGPLVIAGVSVKSSSLKFLQESNVRDSKVLLPSTRRRLYDLIVSVAEKISVVEVSPQEIDPYVKYGKKLHRLNYLEAVKMAEILDTLGAQVVYVDSPDVKPERLELDLLSLSSVKPKIVARHHADQDFVVVSAASIIAKVARDKRIDELAERHGFFGSGYPSDPRTMAFVRNWLETKGELPEFVRRSWKSLKKIHSKKLDEY